MMERNLLIEMYSIQFDYPKSDAISLRDVQTDQLLTENDRPEWVKSTRNEPAAYPRGTQPVIMVRFFVVKASMAGKYTIGAKGNIANIAEKTVKLEFDRFHGAGISATIEFEFEAPLPGAIGLHHLTLSWYATPVGSEKTFFLGDSEHKICTTFRKPELNDDDDEIHDWVYTPLMLWTSEWAAGKDNEKDICDAIIENLYRSGLQYGIPGWNVRYILLTGGGMCSGWYRVFQQMAHCQGVYVYCRWFGVVWRENFLREKQVAWNGIVVSDGGLNQINPTYPPAYFHDNDVEFPIKDKIKMKDPAVDYRYVFCGNSHGPYDGHCINFLQYEGKLFLYDPSFGKGPIEVDMALPPENDEIWGGKKIASFKANYLDKNVDYMLGSFYNGDKLYETKEYDKNGESLLVPAYGMTVKTSLIPDTFMENGKQYDSLAFYWGLIAGWREKTPATAEEEEETTKKKMDPKDSIRLLESLHSPDGARKRCDMDDIISAINSLGKALGEKETDPKSAQHLSDIVTKKIHIPLHPTSRLPHSMCPEDMVKFSALRELAGFNPDNCAKAVEQGYDTADSPLLKKVMEILKNKK
ncbi:MAG: hypothetical protein GY757_41645 [bacterium]|nr:hypothetical protein [bacterium]